MEIYNRYLDLETLRKIFVQKDNKEEITIYTDEVKEYKKTLKFFNIKKVKVELKFFNYEKSKFELMNLIEKGYNKKVILMYGKGEISKNAIDKKNLEMLKKMSLEEYSEIMMPYLVKRGYEITDIKVLQLFKNVAKNAGSLIWYIQKFFIEEGFNDEFILPKELNKTDKEIFKKQVSNIIRSDDKFITNFILRLCDTQIFDFDILSYIDLVDFDYLVRRLFN